MVVEDIGEEPLEFDYFVGTEKLLITRLVEGSFVFFVVYFGEAALDLFGVEEVEEDLGIIIVFFAADGIEVDDVFEEPVLGFGGNYFSETAVRAMNQESAKSADLGGYRNLCPLCLLSAHIYELGE